MNLLLFLLVLLPAGTVALLGYALRPRGWVVAPGRLTLVRTAVLSGGYAVLSVEVLSALHGLTTAGVVSVWGLALILAGGAAGWRHRSDSPGGGEPRTPLGERWHGLSRTERPVAVAIGCLLLGELVLALVSPPNTFDSQTYHLPKVEHWAAQHDVSFYPVRIHRQVTFAPGAEYLLLHLRLLTHGDVLYGLLQWSAGVTAVLAVTRLTAQLGGGRRAQLLAAFVLASTPALVLEASSTQTDLVVAGWVACLATLVLDGVGGRRADPATADGARPLSGPATVVLLGIATGLIALTKQTGLFAAAPLLVWWGLARLRRGAVAGHPGRAVARLAAATLVVLAITTAITGPYVWRVYTEFGNPLGPDYLRTSMTMQRHDPPALVVNGLRQAQTLLDTPVPYLSHVTAAGVEAVARLLGLNPSDPAITFDNTRFPAVAWYPSEDKAAYPVQAVIMMVGVVACLVRPALGGLWAAARRRRVYASAVLVGLALHASILKWQPWGNRLFLYLVVLAAPPAGLMLAAVFDAAGERRARAAGGEWTVREKRARAVAARRGVGAAPVQAVPAQPVPAQPAPVQPAPVRAPSVAATVGVPGAASRRPRGRAVLVGAVAALLVVGGVAGGLSVLYGWPRRLVGSDSVFALDRWHARFVTRPAWADQYSAVAAVVRASGAQYVGIVQQNDTWEYPWWLLLRGRTLIAMTSMLPHHPPSYRRIDAVVCAGSEAACRNSAPAGWQVHMDGEVGWALPPSRVPPNAARPSAPSR